MDLTEVSSINTLTVHSVLAEVGPDLSKFRSAAAFASWLGLCPDNRISGGKVLSVRTRHDVATGNIRHRRVLVDVPRTEGIPDGLAVDEQGFLWSAQCAQNRAALALRVAAQTLHHNQSALGHYYRRMRAKLGAPKAITATAHKLARIIYYLLTTGQRYQETVFAEREKQHRLRTITRLKAQVQALGFQSVPLAD
ncbi:MAG: transposase [Bryobacteraceae bacterium]